MRRCYPMVILGALFGLSVAQSRFGGLSSALANESLKSKPEVASASPKWSQTMRQLYHELSTILTDVTSDERFSNSKARTELQSSVLRMSKLAHDLNRKGLSSPDSDPSVIIFGKLFADETAYAEKALRSGHEKYAREILRNIPGYCIACHTRTHTGPSFDSLPLNPTVDRLRPIERGEFFAASRQYDRALTEFDRVLSDDSAPRTRPVEWSHAVKYSLAVAIRVKRDPILAGAIVDRILGSPDAPAFLMEDAAQWRKSIRAWHEEPKHAAMTEEGIHSEAVRLLAQAHDTQKFQADHSADIEYLRASAAVHDLLQLGPKGRYVSDGYLMAGMCYDVLRSFHIGEVYEIYYEACIRNEPHTALAQACFRRLQSGLFEGYTGSGGTSLPDDLRIKLKDLETLSRAIAPTVPTSPH